MSFKSFIGSHLSPQWYVQSTCAVIGTGLYEGLDWIAAQMSKR